MLFRLSSLVSALLLLLLGARRRVLEAGPVSLVYYVMGPEDGEPWLMVHGLGSIAVSWAPVMRRLRRSCRMVVPEMSALGGTRCPELGIGVAASGEILRKLMEHEFGSRPVTLMGLSLGGWMAARLALAQPQRISRLVLVDAGGYRDQDWDNIETLVRVEDLAGVDRLYKALFVRVPWVMRLSKATFLKAYTSRAVRNVLDGLSEADTYSGEDLARLPMPTALIWAERDGLFTARMARAMAAAIPHARLEILPNCGHAVHLERPAALTAAIQRFRLESSQTLPLTTGGRPWQAPST